MQLSTMFTSATTKDFKISLSIMCLDMMHLEAVMLQDIYTAFGNPLRLVELANLQFSLGQLLPARASNLMVQRKSLSPLATQLFAMS